MKITLDELTALPHQRLTFPFNEKLDSVSAVKPVLGELTIVYSASGLCLTGLITTLLKLECDTCLRPYFQHVSIDLDEKFISPEYASEESDIREKELHQGDFVEMIPANGVLDITDVVYQAVTLATPCFCRCGDECPGPPGASDSDALQASGNRAAGKSGVDEGKPIDPRWKNLKTLFPKEDSQQNS